WDMVLHTGVTRSSRAVRSTREAAARTSCGDVEEARGKRKPHTQYRSESDRTRGLEMRLSMDTPLDLPRILAMARGDEPAELVLRRGRLVNVFSGEIETTDVAIGGGVIVGLGSGYTA